MVVNLICKEQMYSLVLPNKMKGQYWIYDTDEKKRPRQLISIEAIKGSWVLKSNKKVSIINAEAKKQPSFVLDTGIFLNLFIEDTHENAILFTESIDETRQSLAKIKVTEPSVFTIGRENGNSIVYDYKFVSATHASLAYDGISWSVTDNTSRNGTYVNGYRVRDMHLKAGDCICIMGLKIVIGGNFLAINNPDRRVKIHSQSLAVLETQKIVKSNEIPEIPEKEFYTRSPRFHREIETANITIDPPPQAPKLDTVPLALMLGPSLTMGFTSLSTGILSISNAVSRGGDIQQVLPSVMMSFSMLLGTVLWPVLTKKHDKKEKYKSEQARRMKYLAYLNEIGDNIKKIAKEQSCILFENASALDDCVERIVSCRTDLWERIIGQEDFLKLRLGCGTVPMQIEINYQEKKFTLDDDTMQNAMLSLAEEPKTLNKVPVSLSLVENRAVGLFGTKPDTDNLIMSMIIQMIALHSYDELKIMLIVDDSELKTWEFVKYLPHCRSNDMAIRFFAANEDEVKVLSAYMEANICPRINDGNDRSYEEFEQYYVLISTSEKLSEGCEALRPLLKSKKNIGFTFIQSSESFSGFYMETKAIVSIDGANSAIFDKEDTSGKQTVFDIEKIDAALLPVVTQKIANIEMNVYSQGYSLPPMLTFLEMFGVGKVEHLNSLTRWKDNNPTISLRTPVGVGTSGETFMLDLHEKMHGPHGLVAGMTGSGKSEFVITYILSLSINYHPDEVAFILIDYKGGGLTGAFEDKDRGVKLPHLAGTITNLDGAAIKRSLVSIQSELRRRQAVFNEARKISHEGTMDIYKYQKLYRERIVKEPIPHLFIISDEFAELKTQQPEFMEQLISTARIGRSLGVHLILATQKPSGVVDDQIWSNSKFRVCLKVQDKSDSQDMIKCPDAAELSQTGRFYLQVGFNEFFALGQSAWCGAEYNPSDEVEKIVDNSIQVIDNLGQQIMSVKPNSNKQLSVTSVKQVVAIVEYLSELAVEENISVRQLWLDPIPERIFVNELEKKYGSSDSGLNLAPIIGEYDDPYNQKQEALIIPISLEGNCLVYGATGNGKTTFLTTLCYTLIKNHTPKELNLYIIDFGSETLRAFEKAPQTGGVVTASDGEKLTNLFKMLRKQMDARRELFADSGGDFISYSKSAVKKVPNIVVVVNNYAGLTEQDDSDCFIMDEFAILSREGEKYGIYFIVTAVGFNDVRYKVRQNFKMQLTMQLNDPSDYSSIVGRTEGLVPSNCKGRGLVAFDRPYEFQTAYCQDTDDVLSFVRQFCAKCAENNTDGYAEQIKTLPDIVNLEFVSKSNMSLSAVPIGVEKKELEILTVNVHSRVVTPVIALDKDDLVGFAAEFRRVLESVGNVCVIDLEHKLGDSGRIDTNELAVKMFNEMVERNNTYKDSGLVPSSLDDKEEITYFFMGMKNFFDTLTEDCKDKVRILLYKAESYYKIHFVICESSENWNRFGPDDWMKRHVKDKDGVWVGDSIADQRILKLNWGQKGLNEEIGNRYGYLVSKGRASLIKLLHDGREA